MFQLVGVRHGADNTSGSGGVETGAATVVALIVVGALGFEETLPNPAAMSDCQHRQPTRGQCTSVTNDFG